MKKDKEGGSNPPSFSIVGDYMERTKFNIDKDKEKRTYNGIVFDSQLEMRYYRDVLCPKVESGEIAQYELQKRYELQPKFTKNGRPILPIIYVADFYIEYADGHTEVIDTKGCPDNVAKIKRKLFWYNYPGIEYRWITFVKKWGGWLDYDTVKILRRESKREKNEKENATNGEE